MGSTAEGQKRLRVSGITARTKTSNMVRATRIGPQNTSLERQEGQMLDQSSSTEEPRKEKRLGSETSLLQFRN